MLSDGLEVPKSSKGEVQFVPSLLMKEGICSNIGVSPYCWH